MVLGICIAPSSQFCSPCWLCSQICPFHKMARGLSEILALTLPVNQHHQQENTTFATVPAKVLVLFGLFLGHILNHSLWQMRKKHMDEPALDCMPSPGAKRKGQQNCVNERWVMSIKGGPREKSFFPSFSFSLHQSFHLACRLRRPVPSAGPSRNAHLVTQIRFIHSPPCHDNTESGSVSWFDICAILPWWQS